MGKLNDTLPSAELLLNPNVQADDSEHAWNHGNVSHLLLEFPAIETIN